MNKGIDYFDLGLRVFQILVQTLVPIALFVLGRKITQAQYIKSSLDAWNEFNKAIVANDANAMIAQKSYGFSWTKDSPEAYREAHLVFMVLNALAIAHYGRLHGLVPHEMFDENLHLLRAWLSNDKVFELSQSRGYPRRFRELCLAVRECPASEAFGGKSRFRTRLAKLKYFVLARSTKAFGGKSRFRTGLSKLKYFGLARSTNPARERAPVIATIDMTSSEAVVLDAILRRYSESGTLAIKSLGEQQCLWNIQCLLEKHRDRPNWPSLDDATAELTLEES